MKQQATKNMPILKDFRETKAISLPDHEGSEIVIYSSVLIKDMSSVSVVDNENLSMAQVLDLLTKLIKSWNFTNEEGELLPVNADNLGLLKTSDFEFIMKEVKGLQESTQKKG